ncbi:MAG: TIGR00282 family metallophosphoesterase [Alphaproteobacteria bacterium]|nr:TIGR00282 family metallophosphoesterase [Alphaproteobacteria bacterium]
MKILFCGDVVGRSGREAVQKQVPRLRKEHALDFVVVNGDNAAGGFGINPTICREFFAAGVDVITGGDHIWDQKEIIPTLAVEKRLLRPHNFPVRNPGNGFQIYTLANGEKIAVIHLLGQVFHKESLDCPFAMAEQLLTGFKLGVQANAILVDFHAEATSEKCAMGMFLDGRVSVVVGSHTHIPTADAKILPKGTAYQTDAGMCGDYNSVIGFQPDAPLERFLTKIGKAKLEAATGAATLCGLLVETDDKTGLAVAVQAISLKN